MQSSSQEKLIKQRIINSLDYLKRSKNIFIPPYDENTSMEELQFIYNHVRQSEDQRNLEKKQFQLDKNIRYTKLLIPKVSKNYTNILFPSTEKDCNDHPMKIVTEDIIRLAINVKLDELSLMNEKNKSNNV